MFEPRFLQHPWIHIILEMTVVEWQTKTVQPKLSEEFRIGIREEVLQPLIEEEFVLLRSQNLTHGSPVLRLVAREAGDEVLHAKHRH